jgi:hypothetical protein
MTRLPTAWLARLLAAAVVLTLTLAGAPPARASAELRQELATLAKDLKKVLADRKLDSLGMGQFTGPPNFPTSAGPGIIQVLTEELKKLGITVKKRAKIGLEGKYLVTEVKDEDNPRQKLLCLVVKASLVDDLGKPLLDLSFERKVKGQQALLQLIGTSAELPPDGDKERDKKVRESYADPKVYKEKPREKKDGPATVVRAAKGSKFGMEVLVAGKGLPVTDDEGLAYVSVGRGKVYKIRLINDSDQEMAVRLTIDGISVFAFSQLRHKAGPKKGEPLYGVWIVPAKKSITVKGWHKDNAVSQSFLVTEYAKTAAAYLKQSAGLGTITATWAASWPAAGLPPRDEPGKSKSLNPGDGTGFGPPVKAKVREVKRKVGVVRASISVRYTRK